MKTLPEKLKIWIIAQQFSVRARIREVLINVLVKPNLKVYGSPKQINLKVDQEFAPDIAIMARSMGVDEMSRISGLIRGDNPECSKTKIIVAIDGRGNLESTAVVDLYFAGVDGFISEPFSIDDIQKLFFTLLNNPYGSAGINKTHHSTLYVLRDATQYVDQIAHQVAIGEEVPVHARKELQKVSATLQKLHLQGTEDFAKALIEAFVAIPPPKPLDPRSAQKRLAAKKSLVVHPGKTIAAVIQERGFAIETLASTMRIEKELLTQLVEEKIGIDEPLAQALARGLGRSPKEWLGLQKAYDKQQEEKNKKKRT